MIYRLSTILCVLFMMSSPALQAADLGPCECWYAGYEDAPEFAWHQRQETEGHAKCDRSGLRKYYEEGFTQSMKREARQCPYQR